MYSNFLHVIDILGTFAFAVSGVFSAMERKFDPFGVMIISFVTAIGGGTIRDVLVGIYPVTWLQDNITITVIFFSVLLTMFFSSYLKQLNNALFLFDALGLGVFTITGFEVGIKHGLSAGVCVALGTISACFGSILRDVLLNKVPLIFQKEIYALACIIGASVYYLLVHVNLNEDISKVICIVLIFVIRIVSFRFKLSLPPISLK